MSELKVQVVPAPQIIEKLFQTIIGPLGATHIASLLVEPDHIEERVHLLVQTFDLYPEYKAPFAALIKALQGGKQTSPITLEEQIRYFNTKHTRYWLLVNLMNRVLMIKELELDLTTGRLPARAHDLLKFAHKARDEFGEESRYKDVIFACGFLFDFLFYLQRSTFLDIGQTRYDDPLGQAFTKAIEQGKKIVQLSKYKARFDLGVFAPGTAFMRQLAHFCIILIKMSEGTDFYKKIETLKPTEPLKLAMEMKQFQVHSGMIASYLARSLPVFGRLGEVMSLWGFPYLNTEKELKDVHDVAAIGMLGVAISEQGLKGTDFGTIEKPFVKIPELRYLDFTISKEVRDEIKI